MVSQGAALSDGDSLQMKKLWKQYQKLQQKKYRKLWGLFPVEGTRMCREAIRSGWEITNIYLNESFLENKASAEFEEYFRQLDLPPVILSDSNFSQLAFTKTPQGIFFVMKQPDLPKELSELIASKQFVVVLDGIRDSGNVGTIVRTAEWFGVQLIISSDDSVDFYNPKVLRATMGSIFRIPHVEVESLPRAVANLKKSGFTVIGTAADAEHTLSEMSIKPPLAVILGGEANGISTGILRSVDRMAAIKRKGNAESLNVAVAAGILMHHFSEFVN